MVASAEFPALIMPFDMNWSGEILLLEFVFMLGYWWVIV